MREIQACFSNKDLQYLFSDARRGISQVEVRIEGRLLSGGKFRDTVNHYVLLLANDCLALRATPNPLNPETVISFATAAAGPVTVEVFDVQGRLVKTLHNGTMEAGDELDPVGWLDANRQSGRDGRLLRERPVGDRERRPSGSRCSSRAIRYSSKAN